MAPAAARVTVPVNVNFALFVAQSAGLAVPRPLSRLTDGRWPPAYLGRDLTSAGARAATRAWSAWMAELAEANDRLALMDPGQRAAAGWRAIGIDPNEGFGMLARWPALRDLAARAWPDFRDGFWGGRGGLTFALSGVTRLVAEAAPSLAHPPAVVDVVYAAAPVAVLFGPGHVLLGCGAATTVEAAARAITQAHRT